VVQSATEAEPNWQLLVLSPINTPWDFFTSLQPHVVPSLAALKASEPGLRHPVPIMGPSKATEWLTCPPTFHAFGWVYRRDLVRQLARSFLWRSPRLNPLDVWVWEVMAQCGQLRWAIAPKRPMINSAGVGTDAKLPSVKDKQDDSATRYKVHQGRTKPPPRPPFDSNAWKTCTN